MPEKTIEQKLMGSLQQSAMVIQKLKTQLNRYTEPIAIIGMGCRFPGGSDSPEQFWQLLAQGVDAVTAMPDDRRSVRANMAEVPPCYGGFLSEVDTFDSTFFSISPREARMMDPQQRLLLEVSWEALESAALVPETLLNSPSGVFIGMCNFDYAMLSHQQEIDSPQDELYRLTGQGLSVAAGRLAYLFGFTGPAVVVDTACSSSLVAIHQACQSLRNRECHLALAGGVNLILNDQWVPDGTTSEDRLHALDGRCKTFDAAANGFGRGEGCGVVVLKRLSDAQADGNQILAVIRGSMINQDGRSSGLTAPNGPSQQAVIRQALHNARLTPDQISYIEAHGTGTTLGDPIEIGALNAVFGQRRDPLWVGSVKSNFAHLEGAAGIAGLIKVVLSLQHAQIPPQLHFHHPNPYIEWDESPVRVPVSLTKWNEKGPRLAGISSFGISGTNAHIVVEQAPSVLVQNNQNENEVDRPYHLLTFSAKSPEALQAYAQRYVDFLATEHVDLGDLCYTSHLGRSHFAYRLSIVGTSLAQLQEQLAAYIDERVGEGEAIVSQQRAPRMAFLFTGQGAQYVQMGRELYEISASFRATLDRCDELLQEHLGESLLSILYPKNEESIEDRREGQEDLHSPLFADRIDQTTYTQPALFALQYALATLWQSWGIQPDLLMGHSVGELAAACIAGVFSLEDGLKLIAARARLMGRLPQACPDGGRNGQMVSVLADEARVQQAVRPYRHEVSIAAVNGPQSVVISGKQKAVQAIVRQLAAEAVKTRKLTVSHAFHSPLMEPILDEFRQVAEKITYHQPKRPLVSNVTGQLAGHEVTTPEYWVRHVREAVRFVDGVTTLYEQDIDIFLEIGPKPTLLGMAGQITGSKKPVAMLPTLRENKNDWQQILESLGQLYVRGVEIDWVAFDKPYQRRQVVLPTYPFQRQRYWIESKDAQTNDRMQANGFAQWLASNSIEQLSEWMTEKGEFSAHEQETVSKVFATLEAENRAQQMAAQVKAMLYEVTWKQQSKPMTVMPFTTAGEWLILADDQGVGDALAMQLTKLGEKVDLVTATADLAELTNRLSFDHMESRQPLRGVVHLWSLNESNERALDDATALMQSQERQLGSVLHLVQTLAAYTDDSPRLWVVTQGAQQVNPTEQIAVSQPPLWGLGRVISLEHPALWGGLIDLDATVTPKAAGTALLADFVAAEEHGEEQIAYRDGMRYVARLVRAQDLRMAQNALVMQADATYLITGGLGALGLLVAEWLSEQGARQLVLTSRRGITNANQQRAVDQLRERGVTVKVANVDVADDTAMQQLFSTFSTDSHPLRGVIHAAGVISFNALRTLEWADFVTVMQPKIAGGWLLHQLTQGLELDFFISYASGAGSWGGQQQAHYAAANHFLDGLAAYRRRLGLPAMSIAWGPWAGGMATTEAQAMLEAMGVRSFSPEQGMAILAHLMNTDAMQITAADIEWSRLKTLYELSKPRRFLAEIEAEKAAEPPTIEQASNGERGQATTNNASLIQELESLPSNRRLDHLRSYLQDAVGRVLGMSDLLNRSTGFADLGMDSLMALELRRKLEHALDHALPTTIAFEYPTIDALATYLLADVLALAETESAAASRQTYTLDAGMDEPIAVISMACRFPGADTPEAFWQLLQHGVDAVQEIPASRWKVDEYYDPQRPIPGKMYMREGAFIENVDQFDPLFFGIAPREASGMDPQHRLLLEVSWEALERAGIAQSKLVDSQSGVFVGIGQSDYGILSGVQDLAELEIHAATSSGHSVAAGRLAYTLGLQGPTMAVDTACSSSLVALHLASQSLRTGECDLALAGGVSLMLSPVGHVALSQMQALSSDGRCKSFDASADGYGRGEGGGMVVLKRLSDAKANGDPIFAVIKGSAINHDGPSSGLTVPNKHAQEKLLRQALANAQVTADEVAYIEAHGTGTPLGDPIEIRALGGVFGAERPQPLLVGSVKSNVGHLEAAAGIVGFVKTVLALHHGQIPPQLHFNTPNPYIEWDDLAIEIPTMVRPWPEAATGHDKQQVAGISSFGMSGTNAHIVLGSAHHIIENISQEGTQKPSSPDGYPSRPYLLPLSTKSAAAWPDLAARYLAHHRDYPDIDLANLCYTAAVARNHFNHRLAMVVTNLADLQAKLTAVQEGKEESTILRGITAQNTNPPRIAFLFTGQGSQYLGMGRELYETEANFRATLDRCDQLLQQHLEQSLLSILYPESGTDGAGRHAHERTAQSLIDQTTYTQPALFALEYALATLWQSWGIEPDLLIGHSIGELVAACVAGVFSLEDGLKLVAARSRLMGALPQDGQMVSLLTDASAGSAAAEARVQKALAFYDYEDEVSIAALNGPESVVISGKREAVLDVAEQLASEGIKTRKLTVSHAFHSPLMDPMLHEFRQVAGRITYHQPKRPLISNLTGQLAGEEVMTPEYWVRHVRQTVRFADGVMTLRKQGINIFLEIGPKPTLLGMTAQMIDAQEPVLMLPSLSTTRNKSNWEQMLTSLGQLYVHGVEIDWQALDPDHQRHKVMLPTYPFQRQRYFISTEPSRQKPVEPPSRVVRLLDEGNVEQLTDELLKFNLFSDQERELVPNLLALLVKQHQQQVNAKGHVVSDFYDAAYQAIDLIQQDQRASKKMSDYLTFGIFPEILAGFAWLDLTHALHAEVSYQAKKELRGLIFGGIDFTTCRHVLDFGCGHGTDLINLAKGYANLSLCGYTISPQQASFASRRVDEEGLTQRVQIFNRDSSRDPFVGMVDVAFGIEVAHHIKDKAALFANLHEHLNPNGYVVLADFIAHMASAIDHDVTSSYFVTKEEWAELLTDHQLRVTRHVDVSHEVANFLYSSNFDEELQKVMLISPDENIKNAFQSYHQLGKLLRKGLASYMLLTAQKQLTLAQPDLYEWNLSQLGSPATYTDITPKQWLYETVWEEQVSSVDETPSSGVWLILADQQGVGVALAKQLEGGGEPCILMYQEQVYSEETDSYVGALLSAPSMDHFLQKINAFEQPLKGVIHLWSLDLDESSLLSVESLQQAQISGCGSTLTLLQSLVKAGLSPQFWLVTQGTHHISTATNTDSQIQPFQAALWGLGGVMANEHPEFDCRRLDLDISDPADASDALWQAIHHPNEEETQIAYRQGHRYVARLQRLHLDHDPTDSPLPMTTIEPNASYLITGGLGALGLEVGGWLADQGADSLILVSRRSTLSPADQAAVRALEQRGANVQVLQADVAQAADMARVMETIAATCPALRGVIHAAGVLDDGVLMQQEWKRFTRVMAPKISGSWNLHQLTKDIPLDFFVCFSSVATVLGIPGQGNYAAANAFMDALCHARQQQGLPGLSINWGAWAEVGMAAALTTEQQGSLNRSGMGMIPPAQGVELLSALLSMQKMEKIGQAAVFPMRWADFQNQPSSIEPSAFLSHLIHPDYHQTQLEVKSDIRTILIDALPNERLAYLISYLQEDVAHVLGMNEAPLPQQGFFEIGMDSLMAVEFRNRLQNSIGIALSSTSLFKYATIQDLASHLSEQFRTDEMADLVSSASSEQQIDLDTMLDVEVDDNLDQELLLLEALLKES